MTDACDLLIIGASPAGMSAAIEAAHHGIRATVLDRAPGPGGQIYRGLGRGLGPDAAKLGPDYTAGRALIDQFHASRARFEGNADVWHLGEDGQVLYSKGGTTHQIDAREMLICPGAMERAMPIPGWTLPGVVTAGAAQVMLKSDGVVAENAVFAGSGPLLYLVVSQYLTLGVPIRAVVDTTPRSAYAKAAPLLPLAMAESRTLLKGIKLLRRLRASGVAVHRGASNLSVAGDTKANALRFTTAAGDQHIEADHIFLHHGVIPNLNMTRVLEFDHIWDAPQQCWRAKTNRWGQSSIPHISVAGDGAGIIGAEGACLQGRLAALNICKRLRRLSNRQRNRQAAPLLARMKSLDGLRYFLDRLYTPSTSHRLPRDKSTLVCRCEEVTMGDLRAGFDAGATDPNALKSYARCGMGPCQGRQCGHIVSELIAEWSDTLITDVGYYWMRSPLRPLRLSELTLDMVEAQNERGCADHRRWDPRLRDGV